MFNSKVFKMKYTVYVIAICLLLAGCEKYETGPADNGLVNKRMLTESEILLKKNLDQAAKILSDVIKDELVMDELALLSDESRKFYSLTFSDLFDESKGTGGSFKNLREKFLNKCSAESGSKGDWKELANYLAGNSCYIYCPYPSSFYPKGTNSFTVAAHPIDNDVENIGYRFEGRKMVQVKVNEAYADKYQVLLIMPRDEDNDDLKGLAINTSTSASKGDPIYEVRVGKVRCADYCGGLFEGTLELRIGRGFPEYNVSTGDIKGSFYALTPINYPRDYAKAAINNWTVHSEGGWYFVNNIWDSNWKSSKTQQCILIYEYDKVSESSVNASVGYKQDDLSTTVTATLKMTYKGDFLGITEWDRDWFLATNSNPGPYDEIKDGWTVRKTCPEFKLTTPLRVIY